MFPTRLEIIPSEGIVEKIQSAVPLTTTLTITCLPHHGIGRTMRTAVQLSLLGYTVVPHLAARSLAGPLPADRHHPGLWCGRHLGSVRGRR